MRRIGHSGTFDVSSFGDLLYTVITQAELAQSGIEIVTVAPSSETPLEIPDAKVPVAVSGARNVCGWVVGGGNLLAPNPIGAYGAGTLSAYEQILTPHGPCIWQSMGVMNERNSLPGYLLEVVERLEYFSVRDEYALDYMRRYTRRRISVAPDIAFGLPRIWDKQSLSRALPKTLDMGEPYRYLSMACRRRDVPDVTVAARSVVACMRRQNIEAVVLLAASPCHGDHLLVTSLTSAIRTQARELRCIPLQRSTMQTSVAVLANAALHIGNSYHGGVVSDAYGVPTIWISAIHTRGNNKILGALRWSSGQHVSRWEDIPDMMPVITSKKAAYESERYNLLAAHWERVRSVTRRWIEFSSV